MKTQEQMQSSAPTRKTATTVKGWAWGVLWSLAAALLSAGCWAMYASAGWPTWRERGAMWAAWSVLCGLGAVAQFVRAWPSGMGRAGLKVGVAGLFTAGVIVGMGWGSLDTIVHPEQAFVSPWLLVGALCAAGALLCLEADE